MRPGRPLRAVLGLAAGLALHAQALQTWTLEQGRVAASPAASAAPLAAGSLQKPFVAKAWAAAHPGVPTPRLRCTRNAGCWFPAGHGELGLAGALAVSCNAYFRALAADTPIPQLQEALVGEGFSALPLTPDLAIGLAGPEGALAIAPPDLLEAYARLVREPWSRGEPVRRDVLAGLRAAALKGTAGALGQRGWWAKTGTVPAANGDPTRTAGLLVAVDDAGWAILARLEPGTGRQAAAALAPTLARLRPWLARRDARALRPAAPPVPPASAPPRREAAPDGLVRVRLLDLLDAARLEVRNLGPSPIAAGRGFLGPQAIRVLRAGDRIGPGLLEIRAVPGGFVRRLDGRLEVDRTPRGMLGLTARLSRREYVAGVLAAELPGGVAERRLELGAAVLRFLGAGPRHGGAEVCDSTHCAWFVGRGPRLAWVTPRLARVQAEGPADPFNGLDEGAWTAMEAEARRPGPALWSAHCGGAPLSPHALWGRGDTAAPPCRRHDADRARPWTRVWSAAAAAKAFGAPVRGLAVEGREGVWALRIEGDRAVWTASYDEAHRRVAAVLGWDALPSPADAVEAIPGGWRVRGVGWGHRVGLCLGD